MTSSLAPEPVKADQYEGRPIGELRSMCDARGIVLQPFELDDPAAVRERLRTGVTEIAKQKARRKHKKVKLTDDERRRQLIERKILKECADGPASPRAVAASLCRNNQEVRFLMMDLARRGRLASDDGYKTFRTVR